LLHLFFFSDLCFDLVESILQCDFALSCSEEVMGLNQRSIEVILIMCCFLLIMDSPLLGFRLFDLNGTNFC